MAILQFDTVYSISMTCLRLNRSHPNIHIDRKWAIQVFLMHGLFTSTWASFMYSMIAVDIKENNFTKTCTSGIFIMIWVVVTSQYGVVLYYRQHFLTLMRVSQEQFDLAESLPPEDQKIISDYATRGQFVTKVWCIAASVNCALFPLKSLVLTLYSLYEGNLKLVPWFDCSYPSAIDKVKYRPDIFSIIFSTHIFYGVYAVWMYVGFCPLGPIFILNTCARLELMTKELGKVFTAVPYNPREASQKLATIIKNLQDIYSHVKLINEMFKVLYELSLKASAIMIPVAMYQVLDALRQGELGLEYMAFIFTASLLCYVPCNYSDLLMEKGEQLRLAIYQSGWENNYDKSARNSIIVMLTMAVKPISIRTIFRTVCLDAFADLCHQAYAIFNLINAMWN